MAPTAPLAAGTPHPKGSKTVEQVATFQTMRDPAHELGVALAKFVNTVIHPDGSTSTDTQAMIDAAGRIAAEVLTGDLTDPAVLEQATTAARKTNEVASHIAANRFVFLVDTNNVPTTYLQAATPNNVDLFPPAAPDAPESAPAPEAQ